MLANGFALDKGACVKSDHHLYRQSFREFVNLMVWRFGDFELSAWLEELDLVFEIKRAFVRSIAKLSGIPSPGL